MIEVKVVFAGEPGRARTRPEAAGVEAAVGDPAGAPGYAAVTSAHLVDFAYASFCPSSSSSTRVGRYPVWAPLRSRACCSGGRARTCRKWAMALFGSSSLMRGGEKPFFRDCCATIFFCRLAGRPDRKSPSTGAVARFAPSVLDVLEAAVECTPS